MSAIQPIQRFADLPEADYVGYCWYSNESSARLDVNPRTIQESENPFVLEGMWFSLDGKTAVTYRHAGSQSFLTLVDLAQFAAAQKSPQKVLPAAGIQGIQHLTFTTLWAPVLDANCLDMPVLKPVIQVLTNLKRKA
ncbi:MAG: TIGR04423 family type III CRISPR-associated protein [Schleiferiaceae bacterium]|nr:TIGR04423 family type III CRISPR-associated protein [Schleiferiaceae bacterium]